MFIESDDKKFGLIFCMVSLNFVFQLFVFIIDYRRIGIRQI